MSHFFCFRCFLLLLFTCLLWLDPALVLHAAPASGVYRVLCFAWGQNCWDHVGQRAAALLECLVRNLRDPTHQSFDLFTLILYSIVSHLSGQFSSLPCDMLDVIPDYLTAQLPSPKFPERDCHPCRRSRNQQRAACSSRHNVRLQRLACAPLHHFGRPPHLRLKAHPCSHSRFRVIHNHSANRTSVAADGYINFTKVRV
jgi:hypothetical protein